MKSRFGSTVRNSAESLTKGRDLWSFQSRLSRRLLAWAVPSAAAGLILALLGSEFWRGFGIQAAVWGTVDALIAVFGAWSAIRRRRSLAARKGNITHEALKAEGRRLRRLLWINTALDVLYIAGGLTLILTLGHRSRPALGHGVGVIVQGAFLLIFDLIHAQAVPPAPPSRPFQAFRDPRHGSFLFPGGTAGALLVHGFPGTPAEMLPLGRLLNREGWTVHGLLLPGFGPEFPRLMEMRHHQWREAVVEALASLRNRHRPLLLAGYSLGGALSIAASRTERPDGLLLLAPFWRLGSPLQRVAGLSLRPFLPQYMRLFAEADFGDADLRRSVSDFFPDADPDDPEFQNEIRELAVPLTLLGELARAGLQAYRDARRLDLPVSVIQGDRDELARPEATRRLAARLPGSPPVLELPAGHRLLDEEAPWWEALARRAKEFASGIVSQSDGSTLRSASLGAASRTGVPGERA